MYINTHTYTYIHTHTYIHTVDGSPGILRVTIIEGRNLPAKNTNGLSDPYITLQYGTNPQVHLYVCMEKHIHVCRYVCITSIYLQRYTCLHVQNDIYIYMHMCVYAYGYGS